MKKKLLLGIIIVIIILVIIFLLIKKNVLHVDIDTSTKAEANFQHKSISVH